MAELPGLFSPLGLGLWFVWNFAVLASIQLTVRLIRAFSIAVTLRAALALTLGSLPVVLLFALPLRSTLGWYPLTMVLMLGVGFAVAHYGLGIKRLRGRVVAAVGIALLSGPWPVFMDRLVR